MVFIPWIPKRLAPPKEESSGSLSFLSDCMTLYRAILGQTNRFIYSHLDWASTRYIISSHAEKEVHIVWFGGEPLLGEKIIDRIS
ncbi:MAG: hypothetical protein U0L10_15225, partial [Lachnospiraceae bacterium]|nr:hypothetical protein [Lachnospiraceae bacterium]